MARVAVVTGGGGGIGKAVAIALGRDGWQVVVAGRTRESLEQTVSELQGDGLAVVCDVADEQAVDKLFREAVEAFGSVDLLFNNAGIAAPAVPIDELPVKAWVDLMNINLTGSFLCARAAFQQMRKQGAGRIINNGSVSATTPRLFSAPYTSSKHAISGLTKSLALDGRRYGICCGQIDLGNISSNMGDAMAQGVLQADGSKLEEPVIGVESVCDAVVYMANLPPDVNVLNINVMANGMPFVGRG
ncbi:MAG: SDR family oxidoreductase [Granulosicoccus sp.]|nr:SDR family oxidoreductase [Granulosicoccus sp.]